MSEIWAEASSQEASPDTSRKRDPPMLRVPAGNTGLRRAFRSAAVRASWLARRPRWSSSFHCSKKGRSRVPGRSSSWLLPGSRAA